MKTKYNRQSIRLPEYDYSLPGEYFITICIHDRECLLGEIIDGAMFMNENGKCVDQFWHTLTSHYKELTLGEWVVMPNHVHGILIINDVGAIHELPLHELPQHELPQHELPQHELPQHELSFNDDFSLNNSKEKRRKMLLPKIMGRLKMNSSKQINIFRQTSGNRVWQRDYFEHIIRNGKSYNEIEHYIRSNPLNWVNDKENPAISENIKKQK